MPTENEINMLAAARAAGITSREEMANFMGQMGHESGGFTRLEEGFRYTRGIHQIPVASARREGDQVLEAARVEALAGRPQELARLMYGARMGNDDAGDGYLYRGRGYTQLTGEGNYRDAGVGVNLELVAHPGLAADRENAQRIALWYWESRVPQADRDDVSRTTFAINGGNNGLADRLDRYDAWHATLTPEFVADLDAGRVRAGAGIQPAVGRPAMEDNALRRLETGDEARQLNDNLRALNIRDDRNRLVPAGDTFGRETEQAIRRFQEQQALPVTGRADPATLQAVTHAIERQTVLQPATDDIRAPQQPARDTPNQAPGGPATNASRRVDFNPRDRDHPDFAMHQQALNLVHAHDGKLSRSPDEKSEQLAASLTQLAKENGMTRIDHIVFSVDNGRGIKVGENVVIVQGELNNPGHDRAYMKADVAVNTPVQESFQKLDETNRRQMQELFVQQQKTPHDLHNSPQSRGLSLS